MRTWALKIKAWPGLLFVAKHEMFNGAGTFRMMVLFPFTSVPPNFNQGVQFIFAKTGIQHPIPMMSSRWSWARHARVWMGVHLPVRKCKRWGITRSRCSGWTGIGWNMGELSLGVCNNVWSRWSIISFKGNSMLKDKQVNSEITEDVT